MFDELLVRDLTDTLLATFYPIRNTKSTFTETPAFYHNRIDDLRTPCPFVQFPDFVLILDGLSDPRERVNPMDRKVNRFWTESSGPRQRWF
jgi:hypothetical protein